MSEISEIVISFIAMLEIPNCFGCFLQSTILNNSYRLLVEVIVI